MNRGLIAVLILIKTAIIAGLAQDTNNVGATILITAREWPQQAAPGRISSILADDLRDGNPISVSDSAYLVPGAGKNADGQWGGDINIRGLSRNSVIMLIDGVRVNTATDLNARFGLMDPMNISRVEIIKGPVSSFHGSGSIGGVVNLVTKTGKFDTPSSLQNEASVRYSANPEGIGAYAFGGFQTQDAYATASQSYRQFGNYKSSGGKTVENSQFEDYGSLIALGRSFNEANALEAKLHYFEGRDIGIPGRGTAPLPTMADVTYPKVSSMTIIGLYSLQPSGTLIDESRIQGYYQSIERRVIVNRFPPAAPFDRIEPKGDHESYGVKWLADLNLWDNDLTGGVDVWQRTYSGERIRLFRDGTSKKDIPIPDSDFTSAGIFIEKGFPIGSRIICNAGARADHILVTNKRTEQWDAMRDNDISWNGHIGAKWLLIENLAMKAVGASGYRSASLEERYQYLELGGGKIKLGNPHLQPERSGYMECGFEWLSDNLQISLDAFYNKLTDLITEKPLNETTLVNENIGKAEIYGAEIGSRIEPTKTIALHTGISWAVGRDTEKGEYLTGISPINGFARMTWNPLTNWEARTETIFASRQNSVPDDLDETAGWAIINAGISYQIGGGKTDHKISFDVENAFDKEYGNALSSYRNMGIFEPGRSLSVRYDIKF